MPTEIKTYTFEELEAQFPDAAAEVLEREQNSLRESGNPFEYEWEQARKNLHAEFGLMDTPSGVRLQSESQDPVNEITGEHDVVGLRLWKMLVRDWGHQVEAEDSEDYMDRAFLTPLREFIKDPRSYGLFWRDCTLLDVMRKCDEAMRDAWEEDDEHQGSEEVARENLLSDPFRMFTAKGREV